MSIINYIAQEYFLTALFILAVLAAVTLWSIRKQGYYKWRGWMAVFKLIILAIIGLLVFTLVSIRSDRAAFSTFSEDEDQPPATEWGTVMVYDYQKEEYVIY